MTSLYKENGVSWALLVSMLTFLLLNPSGSNSWGDFQTQWAMKGSGASKYLEFSPNFALKEHYYLKGGGVQNHMVSNHCTNIN